jgi:hypothetical protein
MGTHAKNPLILLFKLAQETTYTPYNINKEYKKFLENKLLELKNKKRKIPSEIKSLRSAISKL